MEVEATQQAKRTVVRQWLGSGSIDVFGIQFSGKDTQCQRLAAWLGGSVVGGGQIMRNSEWVPQRVRDIIDRGDLAPFDDYVAIMSPYFAKQELAGRPMLLSSVGRAHGEEPAVLRAAAESGHALKAVVWLEMDEQTVWKRWQLMKELKDREVRVDDDETGLRTRLERFRARTLPVQEFYSKLGILISVDGERSPEEGESSILIRRYDLATRRVT